MLWRNTVTQSQTIFKDWEGIEHSALNGIAPPDPSPWGSGNPKEEEAQRVQEPEGMEDISFCVLLYKSFVFVLWFPV